MSVVTHLLAYIAGGISVGIPILWLAIIMRINVRGEDEKA